MKKKEDVEELSENQTQNAPSAETPTPESVEEPAAAIQIPEKALKLAKSVGIDLNPIVAWAQSVEARFAEIEKTLPETVKAKIAEAINEAQEKQRAQIAQMSQGAQGSASPLSGLAGLLQYVPQLLGQSSNPLGDEILKKVLDAGLNQMFAGTKLLETIQMKIMADMGAQTVKSVTEVKP